MYFSLVSSPLPSSDTTLPFTTARLSALSCLASLPIMGVSLEQWRAAIGSYNASKSCSLTHSSYFQVPVLLSNHFLLLCVTASTSLQLMMNVLMLLILLSGDVERNPGPDILGE